MRPWMTGAAIGAAMGATVVGFTSFATSQTRPGLDPRQETYRQLDLFAEILHKVQTDYVEDVNEADAVTSAIDGMLTSLDPHSGYLPPERYDAIRTEQTGEYGGLGIEVTLTDGFVEVVAPIDDTPASRAGLQTGDLLTAINGEAILGLTLSDAVADMRGEIGSDITLTVLRDGVDPFDVVLTRELIRPKSVTWRMEPDDIGYIRISTFNDRTTIGLEEAIDGIAKETGSRPNGLVLDLRNNGGGLLDQAISVTDLFLSSGEIVSTRGRRPTDINRSNARRGEVMAGVPIVVLTNNGTASASEIVAGALQDHGRATVLGLTSFGKGSVQTLVPLGAQRGALKLTTARYYTPSGRSIQATGIQPDIEVGQVRLTEEDIERLKRAARLSEADLPNALGNENGSQRRKLQIPEDQPPEDYEGKDYQLDRAIETLLNPSLASASNNQPG